MADEFILEVLLSDGVSSSGGIRFARDRARKAATILASDKFETYGTPEGRIAFLTVDSVDVAGRNRAGIERVFAIVTAETALEISRALAHRGLPAAGLGSHHDLH